MKRILVTGGGTGGHVQPALAVIAELRKRFGQLEILYVGSASGIEAKLTARAGVPFKAVSVGKLRRSSNGLRGLVTKDNLLDAVKVPFGVAQAFGVVRKFAPDVVFGTGGYVSVPTVVAAGLLSIPVLTHEQTITVGLANKITGRFATKIALSFDESANHLGGGLQKKAVVTGNPLRAEVFSGSSNNAIARFGFQHELVPTIFVTGGAQGSRKINHAIRDCLVELLPHTRVLHQCGAADFEEMSQLCATLSSPYANRYVVRQFIEADEIGDAYALADLVIGRSGAGTVAELAALSKPSILIPLEPSSLDEQLLNARRLESAGGAAIVRQAELTAQGLMAVALPILESSAKRATMGSSMAGIAKLGAAEKIVDILESIAVLRK